MTVELKIWTESDSDSDTHVDLFVRFQSPDFSGQSHAWFMLSFLNQFVENLSKYPIDLNLLPSISGGFWNTAGNEIVHEHLHISAIPDGNTGRIKLVVRLAVPDDNQNQTKLKYIFSAEINTDYWELFEFSKELSSLFLGNSKEIKFQFKSA
jgi:hypothetical protein